MPEELSHQPPILLDHGHRGADRAAEVLVTREGLAPEERLEMRPYVFVRIEVGRVARQEVEAQPGAVLVDETARRRRDVRGMPVEHEVDLAAHVVEKRGEEPDEAGRVQGAPIAAEPQAPARADRREHAHTIALSGHPYDGRLSAHAPGAGHRAVLVHARFILEQQRRLALLHLAYHRGELRFSPAATRLVVARERPADGALRRQPEASEQPGDRRLVEHDPEALLDQLGNDGQRPQRKREAELLRRPIDDPPAQLRLLLRRQRRPRPWGDAARQPRIATPPVRAHPLRHRDGVNLEAARHRGLRLAPLENSLHREPPHLLEGRVIQAPRIPRRHHPHHSLVQEHYHNSLCYATMGIYKAPDHTLLGQGFDAGQTVTMSYPGGADLGPLSASNVVPPRIQLLSPEALTDPHFLVDPNQPFTATWQPAAGDSTCEKFHIQFANLYDTVVVNGDGSFAGTLDRVVVNCA